MTAFLAAFVAGTVALSGAPAEGVRTMERTSLVAAAVDDYPYRKTRPNRRDRWSLSTRQCTSFVAWRLNRAGVPFHYRYRDRRWGNATNWDEAARSAKVRVDRVPSPGSVAQFDRGVRGAGSYGHVAYVLRYASGKVLVEDYNWKTYAYSRHWVRASGLTFIHFPRR